MISSSSSYSPLATVRTTTNRKLLFFISAIVIFCLISFFYFSFYGEQKLDHYLKYETESQEWEYNVHENAMNKKRTLFIMGSLDWRSPSEMAHNYTCGKSYNVTEWTYDISRLNQAAGVVYFGPDITNDYQFKPLFLPLDSTVRVYFNLESWASEYSGCLRNPRCYSYFNWTIGAIDGFNDIVIKYFTKGQFDDFLAREQASPFQATKLIEHKKLFPNHTISWMCSGCINFTTAQEEPTDRVRFMERFMNYTHVDSYGECLNNAQLPDGGHRRDDTAIKVKLSVIAKYKFYMALENYDCPGYISEKVFQCFMSGVVPVYMGHESTFKLMPPGSFINGKDYKTTKQLAEYLAYLDKNDQEYLKYFKWREDIDTIKKWGKNFDEITYANVPCYLHEKYIDFYKHRHNYKRKNLDLDPNNLKCNPSMYNDRL